MKEYILHLKACNISRDSAYQLVAGSLGLYNKAFFGHKATRSERAKLNQAWKMILKLY